MTTVRSSAWTLILFLITSVLLASCGGSSSSNRTAAPIDIVARYEPGIRDDIEISFKEPMNPSTLKLEGLLVDLAARPAWSDGNKKLTLRPAEGAGRVVVAPYWEGCSLLAVLL